MLKWVLSAACLCLSVAGYKLGVGIADMTGPAAEVAFMGYANPEQCGKGIHLRQFARSFIVADDAVRLVFVSCDAGMMGTAVRKAVLNRLTEEYNGTYTEQNVMLSGTHSHSTPGGFLGDIAFDLNTFGFVQETFDAYVDGILKSIGRAHDSLVDGVLEITTGEISDANINRSPTSYLYNPQEERDRYPGDTDKTFRQLKLSHSDGRPMGVFTWYAVHPTSMNNTNKLISSDNVGLASLLFEQRVNGPDVMPGKGEFVAGFCSTNLGDVSPNIAGPLCRPSNTPCSPDTSACPKGENCIAFGPGRNMQESTHIIANRILKQAYKSWKKRGVAVKGPVRSVHQFVHMPSQRVNYTDPLTGSNISAVGCSPAMGYSFAAGTTDGPGVFSFKQGTKTSNPLWNIFTDVLAKPSKEMVRCQAPKPILLATGEMHFPNDWQPSVVSTLLGLVGDVAVACVPGEFTTMAGRRLRNALATALDIPTDNVIIAGLCNTYSDYVTTPQEYQAQRYEAASTIFGPHTLTIYLHQYTQLANHLLQGTRPDPGPEPQVAPHHISLLPGVVFDYPGWGRDFGQVVAQPTDTVLPNQTVSARFVAGNPRNNVKHGDSFLEVQRLQPDDSWLTIATDAHWETKFIWTRKSTLLGTSEAEVRWVVPESTAPGTFRLRHSGHYKYLTGKLAPYSGSTEPFQVVSSMS